MNEPTQRRLSHYELLGHLGHGGMGEVYRARDILLGRELAIKILPNDMANDRDRRERFEQEARLASALNHPNIVTIYEVGWEGSAPYIAMELVDGQTLRDRIKAGPVPLGTILEIATQLADALSKAHEAGIVHRDLKPENVMITWDGLVKILDFGLGKHVVPRAIGPDIATMMAGPSTNPGTILGTIEYMSPEQAAGREVDFRSDQFSFASMLYEMATGNTPFHRESAVQTMSAVIEDPPPLKALNPATPEAFRNILQRCFEKDPANRFPSTRELFSELRSQMALGNVAGQRTATTSPALRLPKLPVRSIGIAVIVLVVVFAAFMGGRNSLRDLLSRMSGNSAAVPEKRSLAILPFHFLGVDSQNQVFANGLTESVALKLTQLTMLPSLQVAPPSEVRSRGIQSADDARKLLGVNLVLVGSLERSGGELRVNCSLMDAGSSKQVATETVTGSAADPLTIQDQVIGAIVHMLGLQLEPAERALLESRETNVPAAKDLYLQARGYFENFDRPENVDRSLSLLQQALKLDPKYALAEAAIGDAYLKKFESSKDPKWMSEAQNACAQSLSLNEKLAAAHGCLGAVDRATGRYEEAISQFQRGLQIEPTNDDFYGELARVQDAVGKPAEAEKTYQQAIALRPHSWLNYNRLGIFYSSHGRNQDAAEVLQKVVALAPDGLFGYSNLGGVYVLLGRYGDAIPMLEHAVSIRATAANLSNLATAYFGRRRYLESAQTFEKAIKSNDKNYTVWGNLGDAYYWAPGKRPQSADAYRKAISLGEERLRVNPRDPTVLSQLAGYHAMIGERAPAMELLQRALAIAPADPAVRFKAGLINNQFNETEATLDWLDRAVQSGYSVTTIRDAPNFDQLWSNQRFQQLLRGK